MINSYTRTYQAEGAEINCVECTIDYIKGSISPYAVQTRGYYFHIQPWKISGPWKSMDAFSGTRMMILPVKRQSKAKFAEAVAMMDDMVNTYLDAFTQSKNITITSKDYTESFDERK